MPIVGARRLARLTDNLAALDLRLTPGRLAALDSVSAPDLAYPAPMHGEHHRGR